MWYYVYNIHHKPGMHSPLSRSRFTKGISLGVVSTVSLYSLTLGFAEPTRSFAATDSENVVVTLNVANDISNVCTTPVSLGTITRTGDTGVFDDTHDTH